jgi:cytochrome c oxidase subunit II
MILTPLAAEPPTDSIWFSLFHYYLFLGSAAAIVVLTWMTYNILHYRKRRGQTRTPPSYEKSEGEWGSWKSTMMILLVTGSVLAFVEYQTFAATGLVTSPKGDPINIEVIGRQWDWVFVYPNGVQVIGNLTVPEGETVLLNVTSIDVVHSFTIPALSVAKDAVPDHYNTLWFNATQTGTYEIECKEFCGIGHALMTGTLTVVTQAAYERWYDALQPPLTTGVATIVPSNETTNSTSTTKLGD